MNARMKPHCGTTFRPCLRTSLRTARANRERYVPRNERAVVVFSASPDAPPTRAPQVVRLVVRPVVDGKTGAILAAREIPVVVIAEQP